MAAPTKNKSSKEILDEIFRVLQNRTTSPEFDDLPTESKPKEDVGEDTAETVKVTDPKKSSKHHKHHKHKKHHHKHHKHKKRHKKDEDDGGMSSGSEVGGIGIDKDATDFGSKDHSDSQDKCIDVDIDVKNVNEVSGDVSKGVVTTEHVTVVAENRDGSKEAPATNGATLEVANLAVDDGEPVPSKKMKMDEEAVASPSNGLPVLNSDVAAGADSVESNELEEGEVNEDDEESSEKEISHASPASTIEEGRKKHKKSKHKKKKKKKKKSKEIKRFTAPLTIALTSRSRRLSLRSRKSSSPTRSRSHSRDRDGSPSTDRSSGSRNLRRRRRSRSSSMDRRSLRAGTPINKVKLLEIARKNALTMMAQGRLPAGYSVPSLKKDEVVAIKSGGKSLAELNDFCKLLSKKESEGGDGSDEDKKLFIHHPFKPKEHHSSIVMNIRNSIQIPVRTSAEKVAEGSKLRIQFPVSSGTQHRKKEFEWVPVSPDKDETKKSSSMAVVPVVPTSAPAPTTQQSIMPMPVADPNVPLALPAPPPPPPAPPPPPVDSVFPVPTQTIQKLDIGSIVSQRLKAVRKLKDNPNDIEALCQMYKSQQEMSCWAQSKQLPGQFTGSTDAMILTPQQLAGPAHLQAWVKKDQFSRVAPVRGGVGMQLLQKMGWKPGEGLGKNKEGQAEPIILDIKLDKKGLVSQDELPRNSRKGNAPTMKDLSGKHPVSALVELCNKRRWGLPDFTMVFDSGPDHKKNFVFKVKVNGVEYQPTIASLNKKHAKAQCATVCLQALGLVPRDMQNPT